MPVPNRASSQLSFRLKKITDICLAAAALVMEKMAFGFRPTVSWPRADVRGVPCPNLRRRKYFPYIRYIRFILFHYFRANHPRHSLYDAKNCPLKVFASNTSMIAKARAKQLRECAHLMDSDRYSQIWNQNNGTNFPSHRNGLPLEPFLRSKIPSHQRSDFIPVWTNEKSNRHSIPNGRR